MSRLVTWIIVTATLSVAYAQFPDSPSAHIGLGGSTDRTAASPGWPFGPSGSRVTLEGLLVRSDGETLSLGLRDHRVIRFRLDERTKYKPDGPPEKLTSFHVTDVVTVESEVDSRGYLLAHSVRFLRKASLDEKMEILQNPEFEQRWRENLLSSDGIDLPDDDRSLDLVAKPPAIPDGDAEIGLSARTAGFFDPVHGKQDQSARSNASQDDLIAIVRRMVNSAYETLPNFRAKLVASLFHSTARPVKWIPDNVVAAEIGYEEHRESYDNLQIDGKHPGNAPSTADADYMRSLDKAWSTGDFETLSHCVFSELEDSDFHRVGTEHSPQGDLIVYEFKRGSPSTCISVLFKSEVAYPAYKGRLKVTPEKREVTHVELEATDLPRAFPLDRAERSADFGPIGVGQQQFLLPTTAYWFGCFRNTYSCFLNRMDFRNYRRFEAESTVEFHNY